MPWEASANTFPDPAERRGLYHPIANGPVWIFLTRPALREVGTQPKLQRIHVLLGFVRVGIRLHPGLVWRSEIVQCWMFCALGHLSCTRAVEEPPRAGTAFASAGEAARLGFPSVLSQHRGWHSPVSPILYEPGWAPSPLGACRDANPPPAAKPQILLSPPPLRWGAGWQRARPGWLSPLFHSRGRRVWPR